MVQSFLLRLKQKYKVFVDLIFLSSSTKGEEYDNIGQSPMTSNKNKNKHQRCGIIFYAKSKLYLSIVRQIFGFSL